MTESFCVPADPNRRSPSLVACVWPTKENCCNEPGSDTPAKNTTRWIALCEGKCDLIDEDAQEATVRACRIENPGIIIACTSRTASRSHLGFCVTLCTRQHERGTLCIMIMTDIEQTLSEEQFLALETLHRSEGTAWLGPDLRQNGDRSQVGLQHSCRA